MSNPKVVSAVSLKLNYFLIGCLVAFSGYYFSGLSLVTSVLALVALVLAFAIYKRRRAGYFACAAACFGAFWLARTGQDFIGNKQWVMGASMVLMVLALYLHEQFVAKTTDDQDDRADV